MIKILHFNSNISKNSGVLSVIMNYYCTINREKIRFDFLYFDTIKPSYSEKITELGGKSYKIVSPKNIRLFRKEFRKFLIIHRGEYDILHIHDGIFARFVSDIAKEQEIKKVIVHSHATMYSDHRIASIRNRLVCYNISMYADELFACSKAAGNFMFKNKEFYVMNNAIRTEKFAFSKEKRNKIRAELKLDNCLVVGHVGAFRNQKNHSFLLDIFKAMKDVPKQTKLLLIGDGLLLNEMREKAKTLGVLKDVIFLGKREDTNDLYHAMDVLVLPSLFEGLPMVGVEAQCSDLPIVMSTNITREVGIGEFEFVDLTESPKVWSETIFRLVMKHNTRSGKSAIEKLKKCGFDIGEESKKLENMYHRMIM